MKLWLIACCVILALLGAVVMVAGPEAFVVLILLGVVLAGTLWWGYSRRGLPGTGRWKAAKAARLRRPPGTPLQTTLFRAVLVALLALFGAVMAIIWWSDRQKSQDRFFGGAEQALAELDLAYQSQPKRYSPDTGEMGMGGTGLWFDVGAYERIRTAVEGPTLKAGGSQTFLLDGRDEQPPKAILPPSVYAEWKSGKPSNIGIPSYSFPMEVLSLPSGSTYREMREAQRPWLAYIKEHGWRVGWADSDEGRVEYAMWRTGPNTAAYVTGRADLTDQVAWYLRPLQWGFQAVFLYALLAPFAGIAAWYLNRRIVRPVAQVAAASALLAAGDRPEPLPERGPAELATMARSFNRMSERLAEAEEAQRTFVASVSHELKTPLTSLEGYGELLADGAVPAAEAGPVILAETARLERLVGDLLDTARLQQGAFGVKDEPVSLRRVVDEVARRYEAAAREYGVELRTVVSAGEAQGDDSLLVRADEDRLLQVVSNLAENALRCTPAGGAVTVRAVPGVITVEDTGPGLEPQDLEHAFERFYLYERCGKDRPVGTGLGLSIVKELTEAMGGEVAVQSEAGEGTTFVMRFSGPGPAV
jgi:signal transduction histidine kinase